MPRSLRDFICARRNKVNKVRPAPAGRSSVHHHHHHDHHDHHGRVLGARADTFDIFVIVFCQ